MAVAFAYSRRVSTRWLFARILLPFVLSGGILAILPVAMVLSGQLPPPYNVWAKLTASGGIVFGLAAMLGLLLAREPRTRRLTMMSAIASGVLLCAAYVIAADPFCWRGFEAAGGACTWEGSALDK
jgi:hypothetical protein